MLKGIHPLLGPELLHAIRTMGHGDEIVIADANFPASTMGPKVVRGGRGRRAEHNRGDPCAYAARYIRG